MVSKQNPSQLRKLLPWYVNGRLLPDEKQLVDAWLARDPTARDDLSAWQQVEAEIKRIPNKTAPPGAFCGVMTRIHSAPKLPWWAISRWLSWGVGVALSLSILIVLWMVVRPGVVLQWTVSESSLSSFRIYRAPVGSQDYTLLGEVPLEARVLTYSYVDTWLLPGQDYVYRVEGVEQGQYLAVSQSIVTNSMAALPGQLAILFTSMVLGYFGLTLFQALPVLMNKQKTGILVR